jgi:tetratricopeptide (TPR) repeat protein
MVYAIKASLCTILVVALGFSLRSIGADTVLMWKGNLSAAYQMAPFRQDLGFLASLAYMETGECNKAIVVAARTLSVNPYYFDMKNNMAICLAQIGKTKWAKEDLEEILRYWPYHASARENLSKLGTR